MASDTKYVPGVCNIGRAEIRLRKVAGWIGAVSVVVLWGALIAAGADRVWRLAVFLPAFLGAIGFVQARMGFCAKYGFGGVFSIGPDVGKTDTVEQAEWRRQDRRKALTIVGLSFLIAVVLATAAYFVPV
jgi:hypothetical protein